MIHAPDDYTFKSQLMLGLPASILSSIVDKGVSAETSSLSRLLATAQQVEEGQKIHHHYKA